MATAKKLPSGSWRCLVYSHSEPVFDKNGKPILDKKGKQKQQRKYESFTSDDPSPAGKREAEFAAAEFALNKKRISKPVNLTLGEAVDKYIAGLEPPICSITTISGYKKIRKYAFQSIMNSPLKTLTEELINQAIILESSRKTARHANVKKTNSDGKIISAKTVKNEYGLISAVLNLYRKDLDMDKIKLPKVAKKFKELLPPDTIYSAVKGSNIELAVLLAMWLSFTESEICGLTRTKSILENGKFICIEEVVVYADGKEHRKDNAKTETRKRILKLPNYIKTLIDNLPQSQDRLVELSGHALYDRFRRILKSNNLPHMTFHDLRHVNASVMSELHIADKYALERGGWKTDKVMKEVYTHTFSKARKKADETIDNYFENALGIISDNIDMTKYKAWLILYEKDDTKESKKEFIEFMQHDMQHKNKNLQ